MTPTGPGVHDGSGCHVHGQYDFGPGHADAIELHHRGRGLHAARAAAELAPDHDQVLFDVDDTIYVSRALRALHPVTIDGAGTATIRVRQDYSIA